MTQTQAPIRSVIKQERQDLRGRLGKRGVIWVLATPCDDGGAGTHHQTCPSLMHCTGTHTHTHCDCSPGFTEKVKHADTLCILSEKWDTLQAPDPQPVTNPFQTAFLLLSEADKFSPLVSKQSPLFFCHLHPMEESGRVQENREGGREKYICPTELHCRNYANVLCVRASGTGRLGLTIL